MASTPSQGPVIQVKVQPDVYTVILLVAIIALVAAIAFCGWKLTAQVDAGGYGMTVGQFFQPLPPR
jgi:uncharacterized membrane protein